MERETTATDLLREALGAEIRRFAVIDATSVREALAWQCGCHAVTSAEALRAWTACRSHDAFRDGLFGLLAARKAGRG